MLYRKILFTLLGLLPLVPAGAQVNVDIKIDSLQFYIGQQTGLTLSVSLGAKQKLELPQIKSGQNLVPNVEVVSVMKPDTNMLNDGERMEVSQRYVITAWDSAFYYLPPMKLKVDGQEYESKSLALKVYTVDIDTLNLDKFFPPNGMMSPPFAWKDWRGIVGFSFLGALLSLLAYFLMDRARKGKPIVRIIRRKKILPPHKVAINEIERIKAERKWAEEDSKEYYTLLTETLRTYIQNRYGFRAMEMTSGEIIERLLQENDEQSLNELRDIFRTADLVKFAKWSTLINENDANLVAAVEYINQTKQEPDPNAKPEPEIVKETDQKRMNQVWGMRIAALVMALAALALAGWITWRVLDLVR